MTLDPFRIADADLLDRAASEHNLRPLGKSGLRIPSLAWGMWRLAEGGRSPADAARLVHAALDAGIPVGNGVLTCDTFEQAIDRAGGTAGNTGAEAALAALETSNLLKRIEA